MNLPLATEEQNLHPTSVGFTIKKLFEIGAHLGHKSSNWCPSMSPYIYGVKNGMHIIDLRKTYGLLHNVLDVLYKVAKNKGKVLFVGTRQETRDLVDKYAQYCGQFYVNYRWLGGMMTNWFIVSKSINTLNKLTRLIDSEDFESLYKKKERLSFEKSREKLLMSLGGIMNMKRNPDIIIVLDAQKDRTAILEANKMNIPVIAILDTNSDPRGVTYPIPANDDAIKCIQFYLQLFSSAILLGMESSIKQPSKKFSQEKE